MDSFILGLLIGGGGVLVLFLYDEGDVFLRLARRVHDVAERYWDERRRDRDTTRTQPGA